MNKSKSTPLRANRLVDIHDIVGDRHVIRATAGPSLEPIILSRRQTPDDRRNSTASVSFAKATSAEPNDFRIHYLAVDDWCSFDLAPTEENYDFIQPLGEDEWLLVRARSASDDDRNAHVYGMDGNLRRSFPAGDGIEDVQATRRSRIWISFFDEGVFGNVKLGQSGLVCVDQYGATVHDFAAYAQTTGFIADCYAMNVSDDHDTWLCYYTDFPLVKLTDGQLAGFWLRVPVKGSHAFAVSSGRVLFAGCYNDRDALYDVRLPTLETRRFDPIDERGVRISGIIAFGRSHRLFLVTNDSLFVLDASRY